VGRLRSPTLDTLAVFFVVYLLQHLLPFASVRSTVVLSLPLAAQPWTLVTSVYAHLGLGHLLANALALAVTGLLVERHTTRLRFHAFFLSVGVVAGVVEVAVSGTVGRPGAVVGASGAIFGLFGYLLASNWLTAATFGRIRLSVGQQALLLALVAGLVTLATAAPRVALVAHFTGLVCGLAVGRFRLLHTG